MSRRNGPPVAVVSDIVEDFDLDPANDPPELRAKIAAQAAIRHEPSDDAEPASDRPPERAYSPKLYTSSEFFAAAFPREFLVRGVLVKGQPGVLGGVKKTLKSGVGIDLAISLDTATPFLGFERFAVPRRANVLLLNGESGNATVQETAVRIAQARGIDPRSLRITWGADLPQLSNPEHLRDLADIIAERSIEVLLIDPAYLCLLAGVRPDGASASNLFDMGGIYSQFARFSIEAGATPILTVHAKKGRGHDPLDLDDLTYAGIAEYARQWTLISRREDYEGDGTHRLWLSIGGSAGHSFLGHLDVEEGVIGEQFDGRTWKTTVEGYQEAKREKKTGREQEKSAERQADEWRVMKIIDDVIAANETATVTRIRNGAGLSRPRVDSAIERLRQQRVIEEFTATVPKGNKATQEAVAYRRKPDSL
jgi:AAA domain